MPNKPIEIWKSLNARQQQYLKAIYDTDQSQEESRRESAASGRWDNTPASVWRWMLYATLEYGPTELKAGIEGMIDPGTGSTFAALETRKLIETQNHDKGTPYEGRMLETDRDWYVFIKITKLGRAVARAGDSGYKPAKKPPVGELRKWHWAALADLYQAGENGLSDWSNGGKHSWNTMLRLRDYRQDKRNTPLFKESTRYKPNPNGWGTTVIYSAVITDEGRLYYEQNYARYTAMYPEVAAPKPKS